MIAFLIRDVTQTFEEIKDQKVLAIYYYIIYRRQIW